MGFAWILVGEKCGYIDKEGKVVIAPTLPTPCNDFSEGFAKSWPGFIDQTGKQAFQSQTKFEPSSEFSEGLAVVEISNNGHRGWGVIDTSGNLVIPAQPNGPQRFFEGLAVISVSSSYGYIDKTGKMTINPQFKYASPFSEGLAAVSIGTSRDPDKFGFIDKTGSFVIQPQFTSRSV